MKRMLYALFCLYLSTVFLVPVTGEASMGELSRALELSEETDLELNVSLARLDGETEPVLREDTGVTLGVFWASWCVPCREEFPQLQQLHEDFADSGLRVIGINVGESNDDANEFLSKHPVTFPLYMDYERRLHSRVDDSEFFVLPAGFVLKNGKVVGTFRRARDFSERTVRSVIRANLVERQ